MPPKKDTVVKTPPFSPAASVKSGVFEWLDLLLLLLLSEREMNQMETFSSLSGSLWIESVLVSFFPWMEDMCLSPPPPPLFLSPQGGLGGREDVNATGGRERKGGS